MTRMAFPGRPNDRNPEDSRDWRQTETVPGGSVSLSTFPVFRRGAGARALVCARTNGARHCCGALT